MPIIKSAKKRVRTAEKAAIRNSKTKRSLKGAIKAFGKVLGGDKKTVSESHAKAQSALAKAGKKKVLHKNKVARKQSQLAKAAKAASGASKPAAKTVKKAAPKKATTKTTVKKTVVKKPAAKKAPAKKPAAKK